jgi:hypothetical protein
LSKLPARCQYRQRVSEMCRRYQAGEEINALALAYGVHSNSVRSALARRGIALRPRQYVTRDELLADLKRAGRENGGTLNKDAYSDLGRHAASTVCHEFGSWNAALRAAGFTPTHVQGEGQYARIVLVKREKTPRMCLRCDETFMSDQPRTKHRICDRCTRRNTEHGDIAEGWEECA